jgi:hypothetical protein
MHRFIAENAEELENFANTHKEEFEVRILPQNGYGMEKNSYHVPFGSNQVCFSLNYVVVCYPPFHAGLRNQEVQDKLNEEVHAGRFDYENYQQQFRDLVDDHAIAKYTEAMQAFVGNHTESIEAFVAQVLTHTKRN